PPLLARSRWLRGGAAFSRIFRAQVRAGGGPAEALRVSVRWHVDRLVRQRQDRPRRRRAAGREPHPRADAARRSGDHRCRLPRLGKADQIRMQRHFDELRALETRLEAMDLPDAAACQLLPHPGDDPPIGDAIDPSGGGDYNDYYANANGYSNEELRATLMTDL